MATSPGGRPADDSSLNSSPRVNNVEKAGGLPKYVRMVAHALIRKGMPKDKAIPSAINRMKRWAAGLDNVRPQVQAAAKAALAEWNAKMGGVALSSGYVDAAQLLDLAAPDDWQAELEATYDAGDTIDLAPGDYKPPYDWKHGYIPLTPAAAASKAKQPPWAGKGGSRRPRAGKATRAAQAAGKAAGSAQRTAARKVAGKPASTPAGKVKKGDKVRVTSKSAPDIDGKTFTVDRVDRHGIIVDTPSGRVRVNPFQAERVDATPAGKSLPESHPVGKIVEVGPTGADGIVTGHTADGRVKVKLDKGGAVTAFDPDQVKPTTGRTQRADAAKTNAEARFGPGSDARGSGGSTHAEHEAARKARLEQLRKARDDEQRGRGVPGAVQAAEKAMPRVGRAQLRGEQRKGLREPLSTEKKVPVSEVEAGDVVVEPGRSGTKRYRIDTIHPPKSDGTRNVSATDLETGESHDMSLDGLRQQLVEKQRQTPGGGTVTPMRAAKSPRDLTDGQLSTELNRLHFSADKSNVQRYVDLNNERNRRLREGTWSGVKPKGTPRDLEVRDGAAVPKADTPTAELKGKTRRADANAKAALREQLAQNRAAAGATDTGQARKLSADRVLLDGVQYERVIGPNGGFTWRGKGNRDVTDMDTRRKLDGAAPLSGSAVAARRIADNRKTEAEGGPSSTPPSRGELIERGKVSSEDKRLIKAVSVRNIKEADWNADGSLGTSDRRNGLSLETKDALERAGLLRMDRRGLSAAPDDRYVVTDRGRRAGLVPPTAAERERKPGDWNDAWEPGMKSGDYPKKGDGSPDYGAMPATQQHQVRAKLAGRGEGDRVSTDQGAGVVTRVSSRGTTIKLDGGDTINVVNGTPGHDRIKPAGKGEAGGSSPASYPNGQRVAYNGRASDGTGTVVGRRTDSQGEILEVRDDKDGKTYEWAPEHVKPHDGRSDAEKRGLTPDAYGKAAGQASPIKSRFGTAEAAPDGTPRGTTSTNPDAPIRIEHTPDGTLVHGTSREDAADIKAIGGFKWSRNLNAWYLPRTWREPTRAAKVKQLEARLGDRAGVDRTTGPRKSAAERDAETRERAAARAERMDARAAKRSSEAERRFEASDLREEKSGIPFGQPILVGHHSERRHRRAIERAHANLGKGVEAQREAERAGEAAERARRTAAGAESKVTIGNRIAKNERELRDLDRRLAGTHSSSRRVPEGEYRQRLENMRAEVVDQLEFDRGKMAERGGVPSKDTVSPGDYVKIRGQWYPVRKANAKTVGVPNTYGDRTRTAPWHEISEHRKAADVSRADVADMVRETSQAFPALKKALAESAPAKDDDSSSASAAREAGQSAGAAETPAELRGTGRFMSPETARGITADTAGRMTDDQLERAMQRLMANGDYDGPAFGIIEAELNRRDERRRRAEGNRRPRA